MASRTRGFTVTVACLLAAALAGCSSGSGPTASAQREAPTTAITPATAAIPSPTTIDVVMAICSDDYSLDELQTSEALRDAVSSQYLKDDPAFVAYAQWQVAYQSCFFDLVGDEQCGTPQTGDEWNQACEYEQNMTGLAVCNPSGGWNSVSAAVAASPY